MKEGIGAPHDRVDLYLAPVALSIDAWLEEKAALSHDRLEFEIALGTDTEARTPADRADALLDLLSREVDLHGWKTEFTDRGLRLNHAHRGLTFGLSATLRKYLHG